MVKKVAFLLAMLAGASSNCFSADKVPQSWGVFRGNVVEYSPQLKVSNMIPYYNVATTGIATQGIPSAIVDSASSLMKDAQSEAKKSCAGSDYYAIDNWNVTAGTFGQYNNGLVTYSCNIVCLNK